MTRTYIGIDPGASGGIAIIDPAGDLVQAWPMPYSAKSYDLDRIRELLLFDPDDRPYAVLEKVHSMPRQGVSSTFAFGRGVGIIIGMLGALQIPYSEIPPHVWKKTMLAGEDKSDGKAASIRVARRLFPGVSLRASCRCTTDHDGMAEALLLAELGRRGGA